MSSWSDLYFRSLLIAYWVINLVQPRQTEYYLSHIIGCKEHWAKFMNYTFDKNVLSCRACKTYSNKETSMTSTGLKKKKEVGDWTSIWEQELPKIH